MYRQKYTVMSRRLCNASRSNWNWLPWRLVNWSVKPVTGGADASGRWWHYRSHWRRHRLKRFRLSEATATEKRLYSGHQRNRCGPTPGQRTAEHLQGSTKGRTQLSLSQRPAISGLDPLFKIGIPDHELGRDYDSASTALEYRIHIVAELATECRLWRSLRQIRCFKTASIRIAEPSTRPLFFSYFLTVPDKCPVKNIYIEKVCVNFVVSRFLRKNGYENLCLFLFLQKICLLSLSWAEG